MAGTTTRVESSGTMATIWLDPPPAPEGSKQKPPTMDRAFLDSLDESLSAVAAGDARVAVIRSSNERFFCAGADISVLEALNPDTMATWVDHGHDVLDHISALPLPVIAVVTGYALGGGLELALACDIICVTPEAKLGQTETRLGFVSGWGGSGRLAARIGTARAKELFFASRIVPAEEAHALGIADHIGTTAELHDWVLSFADEVAGTSPAATCAMKSILQTLDPFSRGSRELERSASIDLVASDETRRRVSEFLETRARKP